MTFTLDGTIKTKYDSLDPAVQASLGLQTSDEQDASGGIVVYFQEGLIYWSPASGAVVLHGGIWQKYYGLPDLIKNSLGMPITDEQSEEAGRVTFFQAGMIYWSPASGAVTVHGGIYQKYVSLDQGVRNAIGVPTSDEADTYYGGRVSSFERGLIFASVNGTYLLHGGIWQYYLILTQSDKDRLGIPMSDEKPMDGIKQFFFGGYIYWNTAGDQWIVWNS